jgi:hypothetical protein
MSRIRPDDGLAVPFNGEVILPEPSFERGQSLM